MIVHVDRTMVEPLSLDEAFLDVADSRRLLGPAEEIARRMLFDQPEAEKQTKLDEVADRVKDRFGSSALRRGSSLEHEVQHRPEPQPGEEPRSGDS